MKIGYLGEIDRSREVHTTDRANFRRCRRAYNARYINKRPRAIRERMLRRD